VSTLDDFISEYVPDKPAFSLDEVAQITGFPRSRLLAWCRAGKFEHQGTGRTRSFTRPQLLQLLAETWVQTRPRQPEVADEGTRMAATRDRVARLIQRRGAA
jgi:hypothetical protein